MPRNSELKDQTLELTNLGKAPRIVHDNNNAQVSIAPGETRKVEMPGSVAKKLIEFSEKGDTLRVGGDARKELDARREEEAAAKKAAEEQAAAEESARVRNQQRGKL